MANTSTMELPIDLFNSLVSISKQLNKSSSTACEESLAADLQELLEDIEDYNDAIRILAEDNETIPWEQVQRDCGLLDD